MEFNLFEMKAKADRQQLELRLTSNQTMIQNHESTIAELRQQTSSNRKEFKEMSTSKEDPER